MGTICTRRSLDEVKNVELTEFMKARNNKLREDRLSFRKSLIFNTTISENLFIALSNPRVGPHIKWKKGNLIGKGSYAEVFQCLNLKSGEIMAVKHFTLSDDPANIEQVFTNMTKEVALLKDLSHPNVVKYYQTDLSDDLTSIDILLEYVPGGSLVTILEKYGALDLGIIQRYSKQLLNGLDYLHRNNVAHRDLKSGNILINPNGVAKLTDFGSSRKFGELDDGISKSIKGSPYWVAPEVIRKEGHGLSADIWSFGCVLIEMATGKPPWSNFSNDTRKVLALIVKNGSLPDIPDVNFFLKQIIQLCVQRNPNLRPTCPDLLKMIFFSDCNL